MDTDYSEEQEALRASVRRYLEDRAPLSTVRAHVAGDRDDGSVWQGLVALGATGVLVPERSGGLGLGMVDLGPILEEVGRAVLPGPVVPTAVTVPSLLLALDATDVGEAVLRAIAAGATATLACYEPGRRFALDAPTTVARHHDGDWTLRGTKVWVPDADAARFIVATATDVDGHLGAYLVDTDAHAGTTSVDAVPSIDPTHTTATVTFDGTPACPVGRGDVATALGRAVDATRVALVVDGVGAAQRALELTVEYAMHRHQFGVPIGSFQAVQHLCADMLRDLELGRAAAAYALWAADAAGPEEAHRAALLAKAWSSDAFERVGASAIQVFGGVGFTWEADVHFYAKRLLSLTQAYGGTNDCLAELAPYVFAP